MNKKILGVFLFAVFTMSSVWAQGRKGLRINEVLVTNETNYQDDYGCQSAWIEIFNTTFGTVDVRSCYLTNDRNNPKKYPIPKGDVLTEMPPRQHLLFWADDMPNRGTFHVNFKLDPGKDNWIGLYDANGKDLIDSVTVPAGIPADHSYARIEDGVGQWIIKGGDETSGYVTPSTNNVTLDSNEKIEMFSPISLTQLVTQRLYRMAIVPGMVLVVFSGMIGLTLRKELPLKKQLPWAVLTGMALAFFWQIREDSVWILPFIAVMTVWNVGYGILALHKKRTGRQLLLQCFILLLPILLLFGGNITISAINQVHYGVFLTNDRTEGNFAELMSLFYHLQGNTEAGSDIWISRETIARAEAVSPTLQQLQPLLDSYAEDWSTSNGEIPGDHFSWVLRDAVQDSGYSPDAVSAQTFYGSVLSELHAAVERGDLTKRQDGALYFSSQSRGILPSEIPRILSDTLQNIWKIAGYTDCALSSSAKSTGRLSDIRRMEAFTSCLAVYPTLSQFQAADYDSIADETLYDFNEVYSSGMVSLLNKMNAIYQLFGKPVFFLALLALLVLTVRVIHGLFHGDRTDLEL